MTAPWRISVLNVRGRFGWRGRRVIAGVMSLVLCLALIDIVPESAIASSGCGVVGYAYDAAGRLVGLSDQSGHAASYRYDGTGNITGVANGGTPALWAQSFSPATAPPGASVSITGGCYSSTPTDQLVLFNGTPATITYASVNRLVATVPVGATTGPITVTRGADSAVTADSFGVAGSSVSISSVFPAMVAAGDTLTINGTGFDAVAVNDVVAINQTLAMVTAATSTTLTVQVPAATSSGRVTVRTPNGEAASTTDVFIAPKGYTVASIVDARRVSVGSAQTEAVTTAGGVALLSFDLADGQFANVSLASGTFGVCGLTAYVFNPKGVMTSATSCVGSNGFIERFGGASAGTWMLALAAQGTATGRITATINASAPDVTAAAAVDGTAVPLTSTVPGQNFVVSFAGSAGQRVFVKFSSNTFTCCPSVTVRKPDGTTLASKSIVGNDYIDTVVLPVDGTYTVTINPDGPAIGSLTVQLFTVPADVTAAAAVDGTAVPLTSTVPGQNFVVSFAGSAGQRVFVKFSSNTFTCCPSVTVRKPDGTTLASKSIVGNDYIDTVVLPVDGTYTVTINPDGPAIGSLTVQLFTVPADTTAVVSVGGSAATVTTTTPGQNAGVAFAGTAGQAVTVTITGASMGFTTYTLRKPDGTSLASVSATGNASIANKTLPASGTYTVFVDPSGSGTGSATLAVTSSGGGGAAPTLPKPAAPDPPANGDHAGGQDAAASPDATETWDPDKFNLAGADWVSRRPAVTTAAAPLQAPTGVTAVSGQVLLLNGKSLPEVTLSVNGVSTRTDSRGQFLLAVWAPGTGYSVSTAAPLTRPDVRLGCSRSVST
jgi:YD repeat-containing protein